MTTSDSIPIADLEAVPSTHPAESGGSKPPLLSVTDLRVEFPTDDGPVLAVDQLSFDLREGETLGVVGESGSGKSVSAMAILGLLPKYAKISGTIKYRGEELLGRSESSLRSIRGRHIAMIFQDALASLNPTFTVGNQLREAISVHHPEVSGADLNARAVELLDIVGIPNPKDRVNQFPHEFSGGMRQRAMIAMAIANEPDVLIADEPTTALDVTIQAQVLEVITRIQDRTQSALMLITHDLGVVAGLADRALVMYAGRGVETGSIDDVFYDPRHPYTRGLIASLPRVDRRLDGARLYRIKGQPPSLIHLPAGCAFAPRCDYVQPVCSQDRPEMTAVGPLHESSCHFASTLDQHAAADA